MPADAKPQASARLRASSSALLAGYVGDGAQNGPRLASIASRLGPDLATTSTLHVGLVAPFVHRSDDGGLVGLVGSLLPLGETADELAEAVCAKVTAGGAEALLGVEGHWALASVHGDGQRVDLACDLFGGHSLYYVWAGATLWFSSRFSTLLALPEIARKRELDLGALHGYLALSYVPAPCTLVKNIRRVPPATALAFDLSAGSRREPRARSLFAPPSQPPEIPCWDEVRWRLALAERYQGAIRRRLPASPSPVAIALSGGLDSSAVAASLAGEGVDVTAFHLDFGAPYNEERPFALEVAEHLGVPLHTVPVMFSGKEDVRRLRQAVWHMEQPFGDPVTLPLFVAGRAMAQRGFTLGFNGEGGDQLFAGWPNKAMFAAQVYAASDDAEARAQAYLATFHHFSTPDVQVLLYGSDLKRAAHQTDLEGAVRPLLEEAALPGLFERLRWTNYWTKGSQNILPRATSMARASGIGMQSPLFDLELARFALTIPGALLLDGAREKQLFKRLLGPVLPRTIVERPKRGMGVPATVWCFGPLRRWIGHIVGRDLLGRGLFQEHYVCMLLKGVDVPGEVRQRRIGEKLWQLLILELWLEQHVDTMRLSDP